MREIKFRAWDIQAKCMLGGGGMQMNATTGRLDHFNAVIPMQYTGLKDKNGKEIYEGDIVRFIEYTHPRTGNVVWQDDGGCWSVRLLVGSLDPMNILMVSQGLSEYEVIGNIYENPELMRYKRL